MEHQFAEENLPPEIQRIADRMNVDSDRIPPWQLPELPGLDSVSAADFLESVRPSLIRNLTENLYGSLPPLCEELRFRRRSEGSAFGGLAVRREIDIVCRHRGMERILHLLLYLPAKHSGRVSVFFGLNNRGNHACTTDPGVTFHPFVRRKPGNNIRLIDTRAGADERGITAGRWCFEKVLKAGFATATMDLNDIFPDFRDGFEESIMRLFYGREAGKAPDRSFGAISAWAWGISRAVDCLVDQPEIDREKIIVHGHSRMGKAALWASANDLRIAVTVSNCSGTCGAKPARRYFGENFEWIRLWNPHWLPEKFRELVGHDREIPFDQHFLLAAIAPRRLYVSDGTEDVYADPAGSFEALKAASKAWSIFGGSGLENYRQPPCGELIGGPVGYYLRKGGHDFTAENGEALIRFVTDPGRDRSLTEIDGKCGE